MTSKHLSNAMSIGTWSYPLALVASPYAAWLTAWMSLGRRPLPSIDDPSGISTAVDVVYYAGGLLLVFFPLAIGGGLAALIHRTTMTGLSMRSAVAELALYAALWTAAISFLRWDPAQIMAWYMD
jgi:hypothetical protein